MFTTYSLNLAAFRVALKGRFGFVTLSRVCLGLIVACVEARIGTL